MSRVRGFAIRVGLFAFFLGASAVPAGATVLWYNGDYDQSAEPEFEVLEGSVWYDPVDDYGNQLFDDFTVTAAYGWTVHSVWANQVAFEGGVPDSLWARWEIRSGVALQNGGTLIASGRAQAVVTPRGRYLWDTYPEYTLMVTGLSVNLAPGTYWLSLTAEVDLPPLYFWVDGILLPTVGTNAVGTWSDGNAFQYSPGFWGSEWGSTYWAHRVDFSMGVAGEVNTGLPGGDVTPPAIACPGGIQATCAPAAGKVVNFTVTATDDQDPAPVIVSTPASGSVFPVGNTVVTSTATDAARNLASCQFTVTVIADTQLPTIVAPAAIERQAAAGDSLCSVVISDGELGAATSSDDCSAVQVSRSGVPPGNRFPPGETVITWSVTDAAGNVASATQLITVTGGPGAITGHVAAGCPSAGTPLLGVHVDVFDSLGALVATALTDASGAYSAGLPAGMPYTVTVVTPLGYQSVNDDVHTQVACGETVVVDFALHCVAIVANPRSQGFWKHQVGVATGGPGQAQVDGPTLCAYLDLIEGHFNSNEINEVIVYEPPASGLCADKLGVAKNLLNLRGSAGMTARARQQLMALLLNVAGQYISLTQVVSEDDATLSQAITFCDLLIDGDASGHETAKTIADHINNNQTVPAGMIPLDTEDISYRLGMTQGGRFELAQNLPNPFRPRTTIRFTLSGTAPYALDIFSATGERVRRFEGVAGAGGLSIAWNGSDGNGARVAPGVYFYRLEAEGRSDTRRMVLLK